jgi:RHS repeat-associated protein
LKATTNPKAAITNQPKLLTATSPTITMNLRFPGQYWDDESKLSYNVNRNYQPNQGRYVQADPIGLEGGWNRMGYVSANPLGAIDPEGLMGRGGGGSNRVPTPKSATPAGAQAQVGAGGMFHTPLGIGLGADAGIVLDTCGNMCIYTNVCYSIGPGMAAGLGLQRGVGAGLASSGESIQKGISWVGGAGLMGEGTANVSPDGQAGVSRGMVGVGGGAALLYQQCRQVMICKKN